MRAVCVVRIRSKVRDDAADWDCMILPSQVWGLWAFLLTVGRNSKHTEEILLLRAIYPRRRV